MLIGTTDLQIFCELLLYSQVIFKSMKVADDTSKSNSECEWVNGIIECLSLAGSGDLFMLSGPFEKCRLNL